MLPSHQERLNQEKYPVLSEAQNSGQHHVSHDFLSDHVHLCLLDNVTKPGIRCNELCSDDRHPCRSQSDSNPGYKSRKGTR